MAMNELQPYQRELLKLLEETDGKVTIYLPRNHGRILYYQYVEYIRQYIMGKE